MEQENIGEEQVEQIEHYNPVTVTISESTGVIAILVVALILLAALLRSQARIRELQDQLRQQEEKYPVAFFESKGRQYAYAQTAAYEMNA